MALLDDLSTGEIWGALPNEIFCHIFSFLSLKDLSQSRLVCRRFQNIIDSDRHNYLWASAPLLDSCEWVDDCNRAIIYRAADCGNVEALIKLAVAFIYCEGASEGADKGTIHYSNAETAARLLLRAEKLSKNQQPFSWVLFRPPWSPNCTCCKACIWHQLRSQSSETQENIRQIHYLLGKPLLFLDEVQDSSWYSIAERVFSVGSSLSCPYALFEQWKISYKHKIHLNEFEALRKLRKLVLSVPSFWDAQMELCLAYSQGYYGGLSKSKAFSHFYQIFQTSSSLLPQSTSQDRSLTTSVRYILVDWLVEVADMKQFSPTTIHFAMSLIDRYLHLRHVRRCNLQLLGVTALLLSSRWTSDFILTIRESSWLTENAYGYDKVVRMMGSLLAVLQGQLCIPVLPDYLKILILLSDADSRTQHLSHYLSERLLHHTGFGHLTCGHVAAACFLLARLVLHEVSCPWPEVLVKCTGYSVPDLEGTCLRLYTYCLTDTHSITDNRAVKLQAVVQRYGSSEFDSVSKFPIPTFNEVKEQLVKLSTRLSQTSCRTAGSTGQHTEDLPVVVADKSQQERVQLNSDAFKEEHDNSDDKLSITVTIQCSSSDEGSSPKRNGCSVAARVRRPLASIDANVSCHAVHQMDCNNVKYKHIRNRSSKE